MDEIELRDNNQMVIHSYHILIIIDFVEDFKLELSFGGSPQFYSSDSDSSIDKNDHENNSSVLNLTEEDFDDSSDEINECVINDEDDDNNGY